MKQIQLVFKTGAVILVPYSAKTYGQLTDNLGKDFKVENPNYSVNTKSLEAVVYIPAPSTEAPAAE